MKFEQLISNMMTINITARLWHWMTGTAQHHTTFEAFLTQNETLMDSLMESALGNDLEINLNEVGVKDAHEKSYSIESAISHIKNYRSQISEFKSHIEKSQKNGADELITILDGVVELSSKTVYLLNLK